VLLIFAIEKMHWKD